MGNIFEIPDGSGYDKKAGQELFYLKLIDKITQ